MMNQILPVAEHGIVNRVTGSIFGYQAWGTVACDEEGTLYAVASGFRVSHICPFGKTVMYVSRDGGKTWTPPTVINDTYLDDRDAGIVYMGKGRMAVTWFTHSAHTYQTRFAPFIREHAEAAAYDAVMGMLKGYDSLDESCRLAGSYIRISEDYGVTWSEPILLPISAPHGPTLCRDGSLIYLGMENYREDRTVLREMSDRERRACLYRSCDGGYHWNFVSEVAYPSWLTEKERLEEPHVTELPDGRLFGAFRIGGRKPFGIATTVSSDGGRTWSSIRQTDVSGSPPHLFVHSSGALICSYGRREAPCGERAMVSYDGGETFPDEYLLHTPSNEQDIDLGYPSTAELADGSLLTVYYQRYEQDTKPSLLYTKWRLNR